MRILKRKAVWLSLICITCSYLIVIHYSYFNTNKDTRKVFPNDINKVHAMSVNIKDTVNDVISNNGDDSIVEIDSMDDNTGLTYIDAKPFLLSTSDTDEILKAKPLQFLTDVKNPCFALADNYVNVGNITMAYALQKGYEIRCLPYVYQAGFTKCGTDDIFRKMATHKLISGHCKSTRYRPYHQDRSQVDCVGKEVHWWDNMYCVPNHTMNRYSQWFMVNNIANSFRHQAAGNQKQLLAAPARNIAESLQQVQDNGPVDAGYDYRDMIYVDATPRLVWHGDNWDEYFSNQGLLSPDMTLPDLLHHVNPNSKFILTMRNPTSRLFSDYRFYYLHNDASAEDFHRKVVDAIAWWEKCVSQFPVRACAYGKAPPGMPELGFERCIRNKSFTIEMRQNNQGVCQSTYAWTLNSADRLRVSMYDVYIVDWFKHFPRENFLFLKLEDYSPDPLTYIETHILPFLDIPPFTEDQREELKAEMLKIKNKSQTKIDILPETKEILDQFYKRTQDNLYDILQDDRFKWIQ